MHDRGGSITPGTASSLLGVYNPARFALRRVASPVRRHSGVSANGDAQVVQGPGLVADVLDAFSFQGKDERGARCGMREVLERRILAEIVGAVGVEAAGATESEIDAPGEE